MKERFLISGCLIGLCCRYDCTSRSHAKCTELFRSGQGHAVCPEQLGGLASPRTPSVITGGNGFDVLDDKARVLSIDGEDRTRCFIQGAQETLKLAHLLGVKRAILKEKSPSCGVKKIYHGDDLVEGCGVTAALLIQEGFQVISSEDVE